MKSPLKWVGGKRQLLPELLKHVPTSFGRYYEPFVGGGALFWELAPKHAVLGDTNERLIRTYRAIRDDVGGVINELQHHELFHCEEYFYDTRGQVADEMSDTKLAAWLIYMNKTCFNGLYRVNKSGKFNVPFGKYTNPMICDDVTLRECSMVLTDTVFVRGDFEETVTNARSGDFVYFDPPYVPIRAYSFTGYGKDGFTFDDHVRLEKCARKLKQRGVHVLLSNSGSLLVMELYAKDWKIHEVSARRAVNSKGSARGAVKEVLIQ